MASDFNIQYVARLARISLSPRRGGTIRRATGRHPGYIEKLKELDVSRIEPTAHAVPLVNVFRPIWSSLPVPRGGVAQRSRQSQRPVRRSQNCGMTAPDPIAQPTHHLATGRKTRPPRKSPPARPCRPAWIKSSAWTDGCAPFSLRLPATPRPGGPGRPRPGLRPAGRPLLGFHRP